MKTVHSLLNKQFWLILIALALIFFLAMAAGVSWGLPLYWNVDERLSRVMLALSQGIGAVPEEFYYPTLPFFTMLGAGKALSRLGAPDLLIMSGVRLISVLLATLVIILSALMTLIGGKSRPAALIAALLVMVGSGFATIAHYAHVDIYLTFFMALVAFLLLKFTDGRKWIWLYISFFAIGLAI